MAYTFSQLESLWIKAGGNPSQAPTMAAIALAESSGNPTIRNSSPCAPGSYATGLWQICMPLNSSYVPGGNATNPLANAQAAVHILSAQGLSAWATYTSGAYRQFLQAGVPPSAIPNISKPGTPSSSIGAGPTGSDWMHLLLDGVLIALGGALLFKGGKRVLSGGAS